MRTSLEGTVNIAELVWAEVVECCNDKSRNASHSKHSILDLSSHNQSPNASPLDLTQGLGSQHAHARQPAINVLTQEPLAVSSGPPPRLSKESRARAPASSGDDGTRTSDTAQAPDGRQHSMAYASVPLGPPHLLDTGTQKPSGSAASAADHVALAGQVTASLDTSQKGACSPCPLFAATSPVAAAPRQHQREDATGVTSVRAPGLPPIHAPASPSAGIRMVRTSQRPDSSSPLTHLTSDAASPEPPRPSCSTTDHDRVLETATIVPTRPCNLHARCQWPSPQPFMTPPCTPSPRSNDALNFTSTLENASVSQQCSRSNGKHKTHAANAAAAMMRANEDKETPPPGPGTADAAHQASPRDHSYEKFMQAAGSHCQRRSLTATGWKQVWQQWHRAADKAPGATDALTAAVCPVI